MNIDAATIYAVIKHNLPVLSLIGCTLAAIAVFFCCLTAIVLVLKIPVRVRFGPVPLEGILKTSFVVFISAWGFASIWMLRTLPLLTVAKIGLIEFLVVGILGCWVGILSSGFLQEQLSQIQAECDLATHLTFMQGEVTRSQLEALNERIRRSAEPEEQEITETMFKSISPLVMLFLRKEMSVMKWSIAGINAARNLGRFFWTPKK